MRSPARVKSEANASSRSAARSCLVGMRGAELYAIEPEASAHSHTVSAASHSWSRRNSWAERADWRQSIRAVASPGWYGRNCQKVSPTPTRRRPCTPCATVAATRSAATSSGGRRSASASAC